MSNIQIDTTIQDNAIKSNYEVNHKLTPIALPHSDSDQDESSNNSKKSRRFILNNLQKTSPKLRSSYDTNKLTIKEQISLYQSLSNTDKNNFLIKNYLDNPNSLYEMYSNMSSNDANAFLTKASVVLSKQIIQDYENLPNDDKQIVNNAAHKIIASMINSIPKDKKDEFISKFNNTLKGFPMPGPIPSPMPGPGPYGPSDTIDPASDTVDPAYNGDITPHAIPIMALIVKAFVDNMNSESLDELEQILKADMINKFLDNVKNQIDEDIAKYKDLETTTSGGSTGMKVFTIVLLGVMVLAMVAVAVFTGGAAAPELFGLGAEVGEGTEGAIAGEAAGEAAGEEAAADGAADASLAQGNNPVSDEFDEVSLDDDDEATNGANNKPSIWQRFKNLFNKSDLKTTDENAVTNDTEKLSEAEGGPKDDSASIEEADSKLQRLKKRKRLGKKVSNVLKVGGGAAIAYSAGYMFNSVFSKNGQVKQQADLGEYQTDVNASTVQSDTLNNSEQTVSKRIDDDSQRISQSSGYCQQAINMLAQAMSIRA